MSDTEEQTPAEQPDDQSTPAPADETPEPVENDNPYSITVLDHIAAVASENFLVGVEPNNSGADVLFVRPKGWVGPSPLSVAPERLGELIDLLSKLQETQNPAPDAE